MKILLLLVETVFLNFFRDLFGWGGFSYQENRRIKRIKEKKLKEIQRILILASGN